MSDADKAAGTPFEYPVNGKQVKFKQLKLRDLGKLKRQLQRERIEVLKDSLPKGDERVNAIAKVLDIEIDIFSFLATTEGVMKVVELSLGTDQPDVDIDLILNHLDPEEFAKISEQIIPLKTHRNETDEVQKKSDSV